MRHSPFHRRMSLLALATMLLLLLMPTVGRLLAGVSGARDGGVWTQMCTMAGLKLVKVSAGAANPLDPVTPNPGGDLPMQDCAYCPVLNTLVALVLCVVFALAAAQRQRQAPPRRTALPGARWHPCGLGSRGPPLAL
ncbi:DUF2946 family protein [Lysobacter sp. S4-A87]|uniref:DUF2946 family protein n=1 Tax=Lysobacter sp. S4-A87 TaxID=2925843 RepID=UPI001F52D208|nr:DUF2946 family protein [Lysobacter sp. S4-A87]UNK50767.1 DUF2946 family protein [Lysobacter sp. S4-A87]